MANTTQLRNALTKLYPSDSDARRIVEDANIEASRIDFSGSAINIWHSILGEAEKSGRIYALIEVVLSEYPDNVELQTALATYGYQPSQLMAPAATEEGTILELTPSEQGELLDALLHAFNPGSLTQMVHFKLGESLVNITNGSNFREDVFNLIQWAGEQGKLADLIRGACESNSGNPKLKPFCQRVN